MLKGSAFLAHSVAGHGADCVAKVVCNGRANFLAAAEALDLSGRGGPRQLGQIQPATFLFALRARHSRKLAMI
jgi:hypothetical protein